MQPTSSNILQIPLVNTEEYISHIGNSNEPKVFTSASAQDVVGIVAMKKKKKGFRERWKELAAAGDSRAVQKLATHRESNRVARRRSREILREKGKEGDPSALLLLTRIRESDTLAHRSRRAAIRVNAATGDVEAIERFKKAKEVDLRAHKKYHDKKVMEKQIIMENVELYMQMNRNTNGNEYLGLSTTNSNTMNNNNTNNNTNTISTTIGTTVSASVSASVEDEYVEADAIEALEMLQKSDISSIINELCPNPNPHPEVKPTHN